jgi:8-oxo-dGTP pyrophosphatase MutT (NUDIX family)
MIGGKNGDRFISGIISAVSVNPALAECDHGTILSAALLGESLRLSPRRRKDNKLVCGPGGYIQEGETPAQAAIRETQEEFGITPINLKRIGQITDFEGGKYGEPYIYLCTEYEGEPKASKEIRNPEFFPMDEFEPEEIELFPPFDESLNLIPPKVVTVHTPNKSINQR